MNQLSTESLASHTQPARPAKKPCVDDVVPPLAMAEDDEEDEDEEGDVEVSSDVVFTWNGNAPSIEADIASDLNKMALKEREDTLQDIHGVADVVNEDPEFVDKTLIELEMWIAKKRINKIGKAYNIAKTQSPEFAERKSFRLMFLRSNRFKAKAAAVQMLEHFEAKLVMFGAEKLCKDIKLEDLSPEDLICLNKLHMQFLANRDPAGRLVVVILQHLARHSSTESVIRAMYYFFMSALEDEETQKKGIVAIPYLLKLKSQSDVRLEPSRHIMQFSQFAKSRRALPFRLGGFHFCVNDLATRAFIAFLRNFVITPRQDRIRMRVYTGTHTECMYSIMAYGIPTSDFVVLHDGSLNREVHLAWIQMRRTVETDPSKTPLTIAPKSSDVLLGRGKGVQFHAGNIRLRMVMGSFFSEYERCERTEKKRVALSVVDEGKSRGGSFLQQKDGAWREVDDENAILKKVMHCFRDMRRMSSKTDIPEEETCASAGKEASRKRTLS